MPPQQVHSTDGAPLRSPGGDVEPGQVSHRYGDGKFAELTIKGNPVDKSKTGSTRATKYIYALNAADWANQASLSVNVVFYAYTFLHQDVSKASVIANNFTGSSFLCGVLGGFVADTFLGHYFTIILGAVIETVGLGLLVLSATYSGLQPAPCTPTLTAACPPAGGKYTGVFYVALYTFAVGNGFMKANLPAFGAEQFDELNEVEKKKSTHFFTWFYFVQNMGGILGFTLTVYLLDYVDKGWGFGYLLILYPVTLLIFLLGTRKYRHKKPGGSFITRMAQVSIAAIRKRKLKVPEDSSLLHDEPVSGGWLDRTRKLRFLDKASIIEESQGGRGYKDTSKWKLTGVTQIEEAKRIYQLLPVWLSTSFISLVFAQVVTFTATQGATLDRSLTKHFVIPPATLAGSLVIISSILVPIYDKIVRPLVAKVTKNPYGLTPLKRVGIAAISAVLAMVSAALVERRRLRDIRRLGYTQAPFFQLPMKMWWLLPQYFFSGVTELFLFVSLYEFFFHEVSDATRSIGTSFLLSGFSMGYFFSSVIINTTNRLTKHHKGGAWLVERLNNGGLENYYWLLAVLLSVNYIFFLLTSVMYKYNYDLYRGKASLNKKPTEMATTTTTPTNTTSVNRHHDGAE